MKIAHPILLDTFQISYENLAVSSPCNLLFEQPFHSSVWNGYFTYKRSVTSLKTVHQILLSSTAVWAVILLCWMNSQVTSGPASAHVSWSNFCTYAKSQCGVMRISKTAESSGGTTLGWRPPCTTIENSRIYHHHQIDDKKFIKSEF